MTGNQVRNLPEAEMREAGFTDRREGFWYYVAPVGTDATLNVSINKETGEYTESVLNERFGQHEYYGFMQEPYRTEIRAAVDREVARLNALGLEVRVDHSEYGFKEVEQ